MASDLEIVLVRRCREGRDADRVGLDLVVEYPDGLEPIFLIVEHRLIDNHEQVATRQRKSVVRTTAERWSPHFVSDQLWIRLVLHVDHGEAGVAPAAIGNVVPHDRMMQAEPTVL